MTTISPEELVKALKEYGLLYQSEPGNHYKLIHNARVHDVLGEKVIVLESFRS